LQTRPVAKDNPIQENHPSTGIGARIALVNNPQDQHRGGHAMPRLSPHRTVFFSGAVAATTAIRFAPQPMGYRENMVQQFRSLVDFLQKSLA
jgi:hypothetical protein